MLDLQPLVRSNGTLDEDIWHYTGVRQKVSSDRGDGMLLKPGLYGSLLIGVPICSNHWLHHQHLQATKCLYTLSITKLKNITSPHRQASIRGPSQVHNGLLMLSQAMAHMFMQCFTVWGVKAIDHTALHLRHACTHACIVTNCLSDVPKHDCCSTKKHQNI